MAVAIFLPALIVTGGVAQESTTEAEPSVPSEEVEIIGGDEDRLSTAPIEVPPQGFDPFGSLREQLTQNAEQIVALNAEIGLLDKNADNYSDRLQALMSEIGVYEQRNSEIEQTLAAFGD